MTKQFITAMLILFCSYELFGQTHPTIRTARPGKTVEPFVVGKNILQLQTAFSIRDEMGPSYERNSNQFTQEFRLGLSEFFELQFLTGFVNINSSYSIGPIEELKGVSNTQFGFRINLSDGSNIPAMCLQYRLITRWADRNFRPETLGSQLIWAIEKKVNRDFVLNANLGIERGSDELAPQGIYAIKLTVIRAPRAEFMVEYFGKVPLAQNLLDQRWTSNVSFGAAFFILPNLKIDASVGDLIEEESDQSVWEIGLSWRGFLSKKEQSTDIN